MDTFLNAFSAFSQHKHLDVDGLSLFACATVSALINNVSGSNVVDDIHWKIEDRCNNTDP